MIIEIWPEAFTAPSSDYAMSFDLDILDSASSYHTHWRPRLKVDGTEIEIIDPVMSENEGDVGPVLTFTLLKTSDASAFTSSAVCDFGWGTKIAGSWDETTFHTEMDDAVVESVSKSVGGTPHEPTDSVHVTIVSKANSRLGATSETGLILYDPNRERVDSTSVKTIYDRDEQSYTPTIETIPGMKLSDILTRVLVTECGFTSYQTDLPEDEYPIKRFDVGMGKRFWDSLAPLIGMYSPAIQIVGNEIRIWDSTKEYSDQFPTAYALSLDVVADQLQTNQEKQNLDALMLHFNGLENNYDYTTIRFDYATESSGDLVTDIERATVEFRKIITPTTSVVVQEALNWERKEVYQGGIKIEDSTNFFEFGQSGVYENRRLYSQKLLPDLPAITSSLQNSLDEREDYIWNPDPWKQNRRYCASRQTRAQGLITVDADNTDVYGNSAEQAAEIAHRSNNTASGQTYRWGAIETRKESAEPLRDGQVRVRDVIVDEVRGIVTKDNIEIRAGEVGIGLFSEQEQVMPVFATGTATRSLDRIDDFYIGELPLKFGLPLAERVLRNRQEANGTLTAPVIGYRPAVRKGFLVNATDRAGADLGNYLVTGRTFNWTQNKLIVTVSARQVYTASGKSFDAPWPVTGAIVEGNSATWVLAIDVPAGGASLHLSAAQSDLTIEAKESVDAGWTDLEAGDYDLTPFASTTAAMSIRITAGTVTSDQHKFFTITVVNT